MNAHRFLKSILLALSIGLGTGPSVRAAEPSLDLLTEDSLFDLLEGELKQNVESERRFIPLPHAVQGGTMLPDGVPVFTIYRNPSRALRAGGRRGLFLRSSKGLRILFDAHIVGQSAAGQCFAIGVNGYEAAVLDGDDLRRIDLPRTITLNRARFVDGRWIYMTWAGVFTDLNGTAWPESEHLPSCTLVTGSTELAVVGLINERDSTSPAKSLFVGIGKDPNWTHQVYANVPLASVSGLVRHKDGHLIVVGGKLVSLRQDLKPAPTEAQLMAAHKAAENADMAGFESTVTELTLFPAQTLSGLVSLLQQKPYERSYGEKVEEALEGIQRTVESLRRPDAMAVTDGSFRQLEQVLDRYLHETKQTLDECRRVGSEGMSLRVLADLIGRGFQRYEDRWIQGAEVIWQDSLAEALIMARHRDPVARSVRYAIFRLNSEGHLQFIFDLGGDWPFGRPSVLKDKAGRLWCLARGGGLARIEDDRFEWVDQSVRMRGMARLLGCDGSGRFILVQDSPQYPDGGHICWLYNMKAPTDKPNPYWWYPSAERAAMDDIGRLWFLSRDDIPPNRWGEIPQALPLASQPTQRKWQLAPGTPPIPELSESPGVSRYAGRRITLYCLDHGDRLYRYFSLPTESAGYLKAGAGGSVLVQTRNQALLVSNDVIYGAKDLGALVQQHFNAILAASPKNAGQPPREQEPADLNTLREYFSWFRAGDVVWIAPYGQLEAYERGTPLSIQTRLTLLDGRMGQPIPIGPLVNGDKKLIFAGDAVRPLRPGTTRWIIQAAEGISFEPTQQPLTDPPAAHSYPLHQVSPIPVVDYESNCLFVTDASGSLCRLSGPDRVEAWGRQGEPVLSVGDNRVLVRAYTGGMSICRLVSAESLVDVPITFLKPLKPILIDKDASILCLTPEGLSWIGPDDKGKYALRGNLPVEMPGSAVRLIGRSRDRVYVMPRSGPLVAVPVQ